MNTHGHPNKNSCVLEGTNILQFRKINQCYKGVGLHFVSFQSFREKLVYIKS